MDLSEFYTLAGSSLETALSRLMKEDRIKKYLGMFLADENFSHLEDAVKSQDWKQVFEITHALKGMAANLELKNLFEASSNLCENTRNGEPSGDVDAQYEAIATEYNKVADAIKQVV